MNTSSKHQRLRFLNAPRRAQVFEQDGRPIVLVTPARRLGVQDYHETWRIDDEWWRQKPISRIYWRVSLDDGRVVDLYKDVAGSGWFQQAYG